MVDCVEEGRGQGVPYGCVNAELLKAQEAPFPLLSSLPPTIKTEPSKERETEFP